MEYEQIENNEDDFEDLTFKITKAKKEISGGYTIECFGKHKDKIVGICFYIKPNMLGMVNNNPNTLKFYDDGIKIISLGMYSDELINVVAELYGIENKSLKMKEEILIDECVVLEGNPSNIDKETVKFKCFFNSRGNTDFYAEVYINFDIINSKVEINEKDEEYRANIINTLSL